VIEAESNASKLAVRIAAFDSVDAVVVTALSDSRETFAAALSAFGVERVYAPAMLRIPMSVRVTAEAGQ
jgi:hypothetical protein